MSVVEFDEVWHVGTLNAADRSQFSYEGDGLSVSVHPDDWESIARLSGDRWLLRAPAGPLRLLDAHATDTDAVMAWARERGWVEPCTVFTVTYFDDELDEERTLLLDRDEADAEAENYEVPVEARVGWVATAAHPCTRASLRTEVDPVDATVVEWVRATRPDLHGVWWADRYSPETLSCPRGALTTPVAGLVLARA